jgi:hypothetical protein
MCDKKDQIRNVNKTMLKLNLKSKNCFRGIPLCTLIGNELTNLKLEEGIN